MFKKGDRQQAKNYRPITSLVTVNKTFEHMLSKQVTGHYDPTLYQRMTAYRRHHSCQTTLLRLVEDWKSAVERKELVYIQLFRERLSEKVHATIPKGIVGGFVSPVLHRNLKEWHERPRTYVREC